jgi:hypothetical protein
MSEVSRWRPGWGLAGLLAAGLLGWELALWRWLAGGFDTPGGTVLRALAQDAALLLVVAAGAVALLRRIDFGAPTHGGQAALLSVSVLALLLPVAAGRGVVQRLLAPPPGAPADPGAARSATDGAPTDEGRFLCAAASPALDVAPQDEAARGSPLEAAGAGARDALILQVPLFPLALLLLARRPRTLVPWLGVVGAASLWRCDLGPGVEADPCPPGLPVRHVAFAARPADLRLNAYGEHVPRGLRYVLEDAPEDAPDSTPHPLVLRANLGECLRLRFTNRLEEERAALHIEGLRLHVDAARGGFVPGAAVRPGESLTFTLVLPGAPAAEGAYLLHDPEDGGEREARGLFGALVLEPARSTYREPREGGPLAEGQGWEALVDAPAGGAFREWVLIAHALGPPEEADVRSAQDAPLPVQDEMAGPFRPGAFGFNYHSLPRFERDEEAPHVPAEILEAPLLRSYRGEPLKLRVLHAGSAEAHLPHVHGARGAAAGPFGPPRLLTPGGSVTLATPEGDTEEPSAGEVLLHCHAPNHSTGGERATWRILERREPHLAPVRP